MSDCAHCLKVALKLYIYGRGRADSRFVPALAAYRRLQQIALILVGVMTIYIADSSLH